MAKQYNFIYYYKIDFVIQILSKLIVWTKNWKIYSFSNLSPTIIPKIAQKNKSKKNLRNLNSNFTNQKTRESKFILMSNTEN